MQVFILGMHRSGTSAIARVLNLMGLYFGGEGVSTGRNAENVKGFWERRDVRALNDSILFASGGDWDVVSKLDLDALPADVKAGYISAAADVVMNMDAHRPWFVKEPRLCLLFPIWREALETPICIHIHRNPLEVAQSLRARNDIPISAALAMWEIYNVHALHASNGLPRHFLGYEELLRTPMPVVESLHGFLTDAASYPLRLPDCSELSSFLEASLRRQRTDMDALAEAASPSQLELYEFLKGSASSPLPQAPSPACLETLQSYEATVELTERTTRARASQERRTSDGLQLQLALGKLELRHVAQLKDEAVAGRRALDRKVDRLQDVHRDLSVKLAVSDQRVKAVIRERDDVARDRDRRIDALARERDKVAQRIDSLTQERDSLAQRIDSLTQERDSLAQRIDSLTQERDALAQERDALAQERDSLAQRIDSLTQEHDSLAQRIDSLTQERDALAQERDSLAQRIDSLTQERDSLAQRIDSLTQERDALAQERDALAQERDSLAQRIDSLTQERDSLAQRIDSLTQERDSLAQRIDSLTQERDSLAQRIDSLTQERDALAQRIDSLTQERDALAQRIDSLTQERDALAQERDQLRRTNTAILRERDDLASKHATLRRERHEGALAKSAGRQDLLDTLRRWDAKIAQRKVRVAELDEFTGQLATGLHAWLASRRWRLGNALLAVPRRLLFRRTRSTGDLLQTTINVHEASRTHAREVANVQSALRRDLPKPKPVASETRNPAIDADAARAAELNRMLSERSVALARSAAEIAARRRYADQLIALVEMLGRSRSWRLGHLLLSLPRRATGKGVPRTAADALSELVREYRSTTSHSLESPKAKLPTVPRTKSSPTPPTPGVQTPIPSAATADSNAPTTPAAPASVPLYRPPESGKVDVVVCVHNALPHVKRCLQSVLARTTVDYRVIIVNDGSNEETTRWLRELTAEHHVVELIETNGPLGYTCAANRGLQASTADNVVLLNSDTIVPRLWLEEMLECMASRERVGIVGPLSNAASWQSIPERVDANGGWAVNDLPPGYNVDEFAELVWLVSERRFPTVDFVNGFCFMVSRHAIENVGYLDEKNFPKGYGEENDYCLRAKEAGFELAIADHCFVYHAKSKSFGDATRTTLAKAGGEALERKHGTARIEQGTARLKAMPALADLRAKLASYVQNGTEGHAFDGTSSGVPGGCQVLFVLPVRGGSGGANSVVQEVHGMRSLGIGARVATHAKYLEPFERFYPEYLDHFLFFDSDNDLRALAAPYQVIVATLWSTPALIAPIAAAWPDKLYVYYVQDYEPWFFPDHDANRLTALESYTLIPDIALMAKTDWICRTVQERHERPVYRVAPSLDHHVYHPDPNAARADDQVCIAAMIRPPTPRRAPLRTIRILKQVRAALGERVRIVLFGCEPDDLKAHIDRHARELRLDAGFDNRGVLSRLGVAEVLREATIFVDLSDYQAFGRTGLEAMACACAVVVPRKGGVYEYAVHGHNCLIVDTDSDADMTAAIRTLATNANLRATVTKHALETAARFDILRASVSEISVFRAAIALRNLRIPAPPHTYARGLAPADEPSPLTPPRRTTESAQVGAAHMASSEIAPL